MGYNKIIRGYMFMGVAQVEFDIPQTIQEGIKSGSLIRYGGVVRDTAGHIVTHLKEVPINRQTGVVGKVVSGAQVGANTGDKVLEFVKNNKYLLIGAFVVTSIVGGVTYITVKNNKKKVQVAVPQCIVEFNNALMTYVEAITTGNLTEQVIDKVLTALETIRENQDKNLIDGSFAYENAEILFGMIKNYTNVLAETNEFEMPKDIDIKNDKIIDLQAYLNIQKQVFKTVQ